MLSYLHSFHAGNHADILKHLSLFYTASYFGKKEKPYTVFDTHSGRALYNLKDESSLKTGEASRGILRLLEKMKASSSGNLTNVPSEIPEEIKPYLDFVSSCLKKGFYPGSPCIESFLAYPQSKIFLTELHKTEFAELSKNCSENELFTKSGAPSNSKANIVVENQDGFSFLKKNTPPALKRGYVLCDPSYEELSDYTNASSVLSEIHKKWSGATLLLWYPLLQNKIEVIENMKQAILSTVKNRDSHTEVLDAILCIDKEDSHVETTLEKSIGSEKPRLYGSGMFIVNPCWKLKEHLENSLPYLSDILSNDGNGSWKVEML